MSLIHPTAVIDPHARLAADVRVGPYAVIEGPVVLGPGCHVQAHARLVGPLTLGARNVVHPTAVLGDWPQDRKFKGEPSETLIGDDNIFREGVTVHRGSGAGTKTVIGSRCFLMAHAHVGHNCVVGDDVTLINGGTLGGHVHLADRAIIGAFCCVHQFCRIGRMAMTTNYAGFNVDLPPFFTSMSTNTITQLNAVGLRRSGVPRENISALRRMFQVAFRGARPLRNALNDLPASVKAVPEVQEVIAFCAASKRGVARFKAWSTRNGEVDEEPLEP